MELTFDLIKSIRNLRSRIDLEPAKKTAISIYPHSKSYKQLVKNNFDLIVNLSNLETLEILGTDKRPKDTLSDIIKGVDIYLYFRGLIDINKERAKISQNLVKQEEIIRLKRGRMKDKDFIKKAPPEVVNEEKESISELESGIKRLRKMLNELH